MNKLMKFPMILASLSITSVGLAAERYDREAGAYAGGGIGYYRINDADFLEEDNGLKDNRAALRAYAGFEAGRIFAIEAAYTDFGSTNDGNADMELTGLSGAVLVHIPMFDMVAPYGKAGMIAWDRERSFGPLSDSDDGSDAFYGLGVRFALMQSLDMRIEYARYAIDDTHIDMGTLNLQYRF